MDEKTESSEKTITEVYYDVDALPLPRLKHRTVPDKPDPDKKISWWIWSDTDLF